MQTSKKGSVTSSLYSKTSFFFLVLNTIVYYNFIASHVGTLHKRNEAKIYNRGAQIFHIPRYCFYFSGSDNDSFYYLLVFPSINRCYIEVSFISSLEFSTKRKIGGSASESIRGVASFHHKHRFGRPHAYISTHGIFCLHVSFSTTFLGWRGYRLTRG